MKNQTYKLFQDNKPDKNIVMEIFIADTNELTPHREIKELGIVVKDGDYQIDFYLDEEATESLIDYLENCLKYIQNKNQKN